MKKRIVIALGHRALGTTLPEQKKAVKTSAAVLADMVEEGYQLVITHSNAPQVGMIHTAMNEFGKTHPDYTVAPMSVCSAMSQGYIGYDLQNAVRAELLKRGIFKTVSTILTQVIVDPYDDAFHHPVKVIGRYMDAKEAEAEEQKQYADMKVRIKYMYEAGDQSAVESLVGSEDFSDMVNKAEYVSNVHNYDRQKLQEYVETKQKISELKDQLEEEQSQLESMQTEYESQESKLDNLIASKQAEVSDLNQQIEEAERKAAEEELKRQQEEAARQAAAAETARQQAASNRNNSSSSSSNSSSNSNKGNSSNKGTSNNAPSYVSGDAVSRAYSALGKPYVWGATGPNSFDCS